MAILLAGCGKMGSVMLSRWQKQDLADSWIVIDPTAEKMPNVETYASLADIPSDLNIDIIVFAVKPQTLPTIIGDYKRFAKETLFISIAAGIPVAFFKEHLGHEATIIRAMPNTPALVGKSMTVAYGDGITDVMKGKAEALFKAIGEILWVENESLMNPVTALSGSGPAYLFLLMETLENAGIHIGLPQNMASALARQTVIGSAALAETAHNVPASVLRENVTSPGGTTAAALSILTSQNVMQDLFNEALTAASKRAEELAQKN